MINSFNRKMVSSTICALVLFPALLSAADTQLQKDVESASKNAAIEVRKAAFYAVDKKDLALTYAEKISALTEKQKIELTALVKSLDKSPQRLKLAIAAWSDKGYPADPKTRLTTNDQALATRRHDAIRDFVQTIGTFSKVETVNMANRANAFERFLSLDEAKVKAALSGVETKEPWLVYEANTFRTKGGAGKAVVLIYDMSNDFSH